MTSRELMRWARLHERRAGRWWTSAWAIAIVAGFALHVPVEWRLDAAGPAAASHAWLAGALVAFALAFMRVPFHLYWRGDAALLAQLPIEGAALVDAGLVRCARAAAATTLACAIAAIPMLRDSTLFAQHVAFACLLGLAAAALLPAAALGAAMLVASGNEPQGSAGAILGALPGFASTAVFVDVLLASPWLAGNASLTDVMPELAGLASVSVLALVAIRTSAPRMMGTVLRDVSALDRQRLATLEIRPPTALERGVASLLGDAALPYRKDARLMRRRYPMAYALGALGFIVLAIVGLARPNDPTPWLVATLAGAALYAIALAGRLRRAPIELPRLSSTLPIAPSARARAKLAWLVVWLAIYVLVPATFALLSRN